VANPTEDLHKQFTRHKFWFFWGAFWSMWCVTGIIHSFTVRHWLSVGIFIFLGLLNLVSSNTHWHKMNDIAHKYKSFGEQNGR
jgi:hypothetical protein